MRLPTLSPRWLAGAAAAACATAMIPVAAALAVTAPAAVPAASPPACASAGLVVWMDTQGDGAAGTIYYTLNFTNLSGHACTLHGSPGVSAVSLAGHQIGRPATGDYSLMAPTVRLANGATATALLAWSDVQTHSGRFCGQVTAAGLRVYPPSQFGSKVIPFPIGACSHGKPYMRVGPVQKG